MLYTQFQIHRYVGLAGSQGSFVIRLVKLNSVSLIPGGYIHVLNLNSIDPLTLENKWLKLLNMGDIGQRSKIGIDLLYSKFSLVECIYFYTIFKRPAFVAISKKSNL